MVLAPKLRDDFLIIPSRSLRIFSVFPFIFIVRYCNSHFSHLFPWTTFSQLDSDYCSAP